MMIESWLWLQLAAVPFILLIDHLMRDPARIWGLSHPVILLGKMVQTAEKFARNSEQSAIQQRLMGMLAVLALLCIVLLPLLVLHGVILQMPILWQSMYGVICVFLAAWLVAARGLYDHVLAVQQSTEDQDIDRAREDLRALAGRQAERLDQSAVLRTAGESLAENFNDAVVAPLLFYVLLGLPGIVAYKLVNTLDSMWGYRNETYRNFGWAAARLDDLCNVIPARLAGTVLLLAGMFMMGMNVRAGWQTMFKDARSHPSPNAGYPEGAMAGLTGLRFGGPREYPGGVVENVWLGDGREGWEAVDLLRCLGLYRAALLVIALLSVAVLFITRIY